MNLVQHSCFNTPPEKHGYSNLTPRQVVVPVRWNELGLQTAELVVVSLQHRAAAKADTAEAWPGQQWILRLRPGPLPVSRVSGPKWDNWKDQNPGDFATGEASNVHILMSYYLWL